LKDFFKGAALITGFIAFIVGIGWFAAGNNLALQKVFAPAHEQVRRDTFEQSKAYRDGAVQELRAMQFEYLKADPAHKAGLAAVIKHRAVGVPADALPYDLSLFIKELP
jgi:hypothetical protein